MTKSTPHPKTTSNDKPNSINQRLRDLTKSRACLKAMARKAPELPDDTLADGSQPPWGDPVDVPRPRRVLANAMILDALPARDLDRLSAPNALAVVVTVPGPDWTAPVERAMAATFRFGLTLKKFGASRVSDRPDVGGDAVSDTLGAGLNVVGVSTSPERYLPEALVATADIRLDLPVAGPCVLRAAIKQIAPGRIAAIPRDAATGLTFDTLASCLRPDDARRNVRRILAASRAVSRVDGSVADAPFLEDAVGYGDAAMSWARDTVNAVSQL